MSSPIKYNANSILFPPDGLAPAYCSVDIDHMWVIGATGDAAKPKYVYRQESSTNGGSGAAATSTVAGHPGIVTSTPGSAAGGRIQMEVAHFLPSATKPITMEALVSFVTGGIYFVGWSEVIATNATTLTSAGFEANVHGVGALIQTDDYLDVVASDDTTASTALTNQKLLTAGTWYRIGVKTWPTLSRIYVDGRLVSEITHATLAAKAMTPYAGTPGAGTTKILSVDYIGTMVELG